MGPIANTAILTSSGQVDGTNAIRVFAMHVISDGTAGVTSLRNGTDGSATIFITETGTINTGKTALYGDRGHVFPSGCYASLDGHSTSVAISYERI